MLSASFAIVALAHALIGRVARIGHGRGRHLNALQRANPLILPEMAAGRDAAMNTLMLFFAHDISAPFSMTRGGRLRTAPP